MSNHPLLGRVEPDPAGVILRTGYMRFQSPKGIGGLAKWTDERLDLLAVVAFVNGRGMFRSFIAASKKHFNTICVWHDWNPIIGAALERYGFSPETEIQGDGEVIKGWRWDKPTETHECPSSQHC
jgi:hypothetical protein